ncbi:MAG: TetR/AcrR family transcriptional regulator [Verrucomicrobiales bacterium]|nr:TetR/AcrR family transcriptional regulator [Verrucomicrobiales bacterium]
MDTEKQTKVLDAALEVFLRFGFKKTTMGDIARKADMSRPSLYLVYPNKEEILRAVFIRKIEEFSSVAEKKLEKCSGLEAGISAVLDSWIMEPYKLIRTSPESEEILEFGPKFAPDLRDQMMEQIEAQLIGVIQTYSDAKSSTLATSGVTIETVARLIAVSTAEMKQLVRNEKELKQLLSATVKIHASFLGGRK